MLKSVIRKREKYYSQPNWAQIFRCDVDCLFGSVILLQKALFYS